MVAISASSSHKNFTCPSTSTTVTLNMATANLKTKTVTLKKMTANIKLALPSRPGESGLCALSTGKTAGHRAQADPAPCYRKLQYCWSFPTFGESTNESPTSAAAGATGGRGDGGGSRFCGYRNLFIGYSGAKAPFFSSPSIQKSRACVP